MITVLLVVALAFSTVETQTRSFIAGAWEKVNVHDPDVVNAVNFAVNELTKQSPYYALRLIRIMNASSQVIAGINYHVTFEAGPTVCPKYFGNNSYCPLQTCKNREICDAEIWTRVWLKEIHIYNMNCKYIPGVC